VCAEQRAPSLSVDPEELGQALADELLAGGARDILDALNV
jgi:hypothetical protein